jgi:hypothetical protein
MESSKLYVVIVETGEYSDRNDWIGGVFDSCEVAKKTLIKKAAAARQQRIDYENWRNKRWAICCELSGVTDIWKLNDEQRAEVDRRVGAEPVGENGDNFYLVEVPLNEWGQFFYTHGNAVLLDYERESFPVGVVAGLDKSF